MTRTRGTEWQQAHTATLSLARNRFDLRGGFDSLHNRFGDPVHGGGREPCGRSVTVSGRLGPPRLRPDDGEVDSVASC